MRPLIEYCTNNTFHGLEPIIQKLEENLEYDVIEYGCLGNCGECFAVPYVLVDGKIVSADTAEQLYDAIIEAVNSDEEPFDYGL